MSPDTTRHEFSAGGNNPLLADDAPVFGLGGERLDGLELSKLTPYNFRNPGFLSAADLRQLSMLHQRFVVHLAARLSTFLRMECVLKLEKFTSSTFAQFVESMGTPTQITMFQVEPLRGVGLIELSPSLGLATADRLLGGKGKVAAADRQLSEIEMALLEDAVQLVIKEWAQLWQSDENAYAARIIAHETSGRFVQTAAPDTVFVVMTASMTIGEITDRFQMGIPFSMIEATVKQMHKARIHGSEKRARQIQWRAPYSGINVPVVAEWQIRDLELREAAALKIGDVIELPRELIEQTKVRISTSEEFRGTIGVKDGRVAVHLTERLQQT